MNNAQKDIALKCLSASYAATMDFPTIVSTLMQNGFEGYAVDYRRNTATYFLPEGDGLELPAPSAGNAVAETFDAASIRDAIRQAQQAGPDYTYKDFCKKVTSAGCAGYYVSFLGRRVLYYGRTGETHTEHFPSPA